MTSPTELRIAEQRDYKVAQYGDKEIHEIQRLYININTQFAFA